MDTSYLIPAEYHPPGLGPAIPIWMDRRQLSLLTGQSVFSATPLRSLDLLDREKLGIWLSVDEVRPILGIAYYKGQKEEWLACGRIARDQVEGVFPFDGVSIVQLPGTEIQVDGWRFDWDRQTWTKLADPASAEQLCELVADQSPRPQDTGKITEGGTLSRSVKVIQPKPLKAAGSHWGGSSSRIQRFAGDAATADIIAGLEALKLDEDRKAVDGGSKDE
jgi:hypothetical protein